MNKRKAKKMRKKQDMFVTSFAKSYREVREHDKAYHEFVIADKRSSKEEDYNSFYDDWIDGVIGNNEHCFNCKYYMWGSCLHINRFFCNNSELWTPIGMGRYDVSCFKLPKNIEQLIEEGVYTNDEVFNFIRFKNIYTW